VQKIKIRRSASSCSSRSLTSPVEAGKLSAGHLMRSGEGGVASWPSDEVKVSQRPSDKAGRGSAGHLMRPGGSQPAS
jgi:hypothetical protein